jgi:arylsulfatase A-like enzyme
MRTWILLLAFLLAGITSNESDAVGDEVLPNVVFIFVDDQGWTGTSVQMDRDIPESKSDYYKTDNLKRLAQQSMRFSDAYAPAPVCSPSRISVETGKSPAQLSMTNIIYEPNPRNPQSQLNEKRKLIAPDSILGIPESEVTVAEMIKSARPEYMTAFFGKWHLGSGGPGKHGYDVHDGDTRNRDGKVKAPNPKDTFGVSNRAIRFLEEREYDNRPFFMVVSYYAVHYKIIALKQSIEKYKEQTPGRRHNHADFAAMTEDLDTGVGRVLDVLDRLKFQDNTYVFYMSDNGAYLRGFTNNIPLAKGKATVWEGGIRVPLLVRGSGIEPGSISEVPVIGWDLFPTFLDLMGIDKPLPEGVEGGSLRSVLEAGGRGEVPRPREELVWHYPHYVEHKDVIPVTPQSAIRIGDYKLIEDYDSETIYLYDLQNDIAESRNLATEQREKADEMRGRLHAYLSEINAPMPKKNPDWRWWRFWRNWDLFGMGNG